MEIVFKIKFRLPDKTRKDFAVQCFRSVLRLFSYIGPILDARVVYRYSKISRTINLTEEVAVLQQSRRFESLLTAEASSALM